MKMLTKTDIHTFLRESGIAPTDTVLVHTSMRSLGEVEGGCDGLIDAFCSYLTDGLFIVPTHTWANVTRTNNVYDARSTVPCIGALPAVAAFRADGVRSSHPTHSVAAFGKRAEEFVRGEENSTTPCPVGGVWSRLYDENAKILLLGVLLNRNTYFHAVDEMLELPGKLGEPFSLTVIDREGREYHTPSFRPHGSTGSENFENFRPALEHFGAIKNARLGGADVSIVYAREAAEVLRLVYSRAVGDPLATLSDIPSECYL